MSTSCLNYTGSPPHLNPPQNDHGQVVFWARNAANDTAIVAAESKSLIRLAAGAGPDAAVAPYVRAGHARFLQIADDAAMAAGTNRLVSLAAPFKREDVGQRVEITG